MSALEIHYTVKQIAKMWNWGKDRVIRAFESEPDIMRYGHDGLMAQGRRLRKRRYYTYRIPESVVIRGKFQTLRATMIDYIQTTKDDLRAHSFGDYGEVIDCWQWMLEISTHSERHINQIREIKNDPNFPKK